MSGAEIEQWSEFRDATPPEVPYLVEGVIPERSVGFTGAGKGGGKTWADLALAVAVAVGRPWLGRFTVPTPRPVVYFALEGARANIRARVGALARGVGVDPDGSDLDGLHLVYKPERIDLRDADLTAQMVAQVMRTIDDPGLVVFDVLRRAARVRESGEGVADFLDVLKSLQPLLDAGCGVNFAHHFHKVTDIGGKRDPGERMSGSGSLYGHADYGIWIVSTDRHARRMECEFTTRDGAELPPVTVRLEGDGTGRFGGFTYTDTARLNALRDEDAEEQRNRDIDARIMECVRRNPRVTTRRVLDGVEAQKTDTDARLKALIAAGTIVAERKGQAILHSLPETHLRTVPETQGNGPEHLGATHRSMTVPAFPAPVGGNGTGTGTDERSPVTQEHPLDPLVDPDEHQRWREGRS